MKRSYKNLFFPTFLKTVVNPQHKQALLPIKVFVAQT